LIKKLRFFISTLKGYLLDLQLKQKLKRGIAEKKLIKNGKKNSFGNLYIYQKKITIGMRY